MKSGHSPCFFLNKQTKTPQKLFSLGYIHLPFSLPCADALAAKTVGTMDKRGCGTEEKFP